jgi:hypothetical protein
VENCAECGFSYDLDAVPAASRTVRDRAADIAVILRNTGIDLRSRPEPDVWSPLEYACHVRDLLLVQRERILSARRLDGFVCESMGRERVEFDGWAAQEPGDVARQLADAALMLANVLDRLDAQAWKRELVYPYPEPATRAISWVALHTVHEAHHHHVDIRRQLRGGRADQ